MRVILVAALVLAVTPAASALPFTGDPRCPTVNALAAKLDVQEQSAPQNAPQFYLQMAQEYQRCMRLYANAGNVWQAYWAGTQAMQWANGAANLFASSAGPNPGGASVSVMKPAFTLIHTVYDVIVQLGVEDAQYGPQWQALDSLAQEKLGLKK
jgi:hypothetical protein